jgi:hypothetical protein
VRMSKRMDISYQKGYGNGIVVFWCCLVASEFFVDLSD